MLPYRNKQLAMIFLGLLLGTAGCQSEPPPVNPRIAQLKEATAVGGFAYNGSSRVNLSPQQAEEALAVIVYCLEVQPERTSSTFPGNSGATADVGINVDLKLADDTEDAISLGYYTSEEVVLVGGSSFAKSPADSDKIMGFVQGVAGSPAE